MTASTFMHLRGHHKWHTWSTSTSLHVQGVLWVWLKSCWYICCIYIYIYTVDPPVAIPIFILLLMNCSKCFKNFEGCGGWDSEAEWTGYCMNLEARADCCGLAEQKANKMTFRWAHTHKKTTHILLTADVQHSQSACQCKWADGNMDCYSENISIPNTSTVCSVHLYSLM